MAEQPEAEREMPQVRYSLNHLRVAAYSALRAGATREQVDATVADAAQLFDNEGPRS